MKPTDKQLKFAREIKYYVGGDIDLETSSREEVSHYISSHIDNYHKFMNDMNMMTSFSEPNTCGVFND